MSENELSYEIIGAAFTVHSSFGPGLLESVYETILDMNLLRKDLLFNVSIQFPSLTKL
jgi:GxxExxY protein